MDTTDSYTQQRRQHGHPSTLTKWRQITNDLNDYWGVSLTADERTIATSTYEGNYRFGVLSLAEPSRITEHQSEDVYLFNWLDNNRIAENGSQSIGVVDLVKNETTSISFAKGHVYGDPALCGPDTLVVVDASTEGLNFFISKMHLDGSGLTQLTKGPLDGFPECTSDGKWLFYSDMRDGENPLLMRQSLQGGAAQEVIPAAIWYDISPDGKLLVLSAKPHDLPLKIISTDSLQVIRIFPLFDYDHFAFSADNKSVFFTTSTVLEGIIWRQPLDAATAVKVASLPRKWVAWIRPSPDGKRLGLITIAPTSEAVLIHDIP